MHALTMTTPDRSPNENPDTTTEREKNDVTDKKSSIMMVMASI